MSKAEEGHLIFGATWSGKKFRPSDWVDRLATAFGHFDVNQRLQYHPRVKPVLREGRRCLFVASSLAVDDATAYNFIMDFANDNHLQVKNTTRTSELSDELQHVA